MNIICSCGPDVRHVDELKQKLHHERNKIGIVLWTLSFIVTFESHCETKSFHALLVNLNQTMGQSLQSEEEDKNSIDSIAVSLFVHIFDK